VSIRRHIAPVRFGFGLRLGETAPPDPEAWLEVQIATPSPAPTGRSVTEIIRSRAEDARLERERARPRAEGDAAPMPAPMPTRPSVREIGIAEANAWAERRLTSNEPFRDRLVDFWANHFTVSRRSGIGGMLAGALERDAIRPHVTGRFADMLVAVTRHAAMLTYLDNHVSIGPGSPAGLRSGRGLNENLAREVLELHTLSPAGGYTQDDVQALARILTGWAVATESEPFNFAWRPNTHEPGTKTLLGRSFPEGPDSQESALRLLGSHPATFRHLASKVARHFVADAPPASAVRRLEEVLRRTDGDLAALARAVIALPEAWDPPLSKFRAPMDYVLAARRAAGVDRADLLVSSLGTLGQPIWSAPQPNGWPDRAESWAAPEQLMRRVEWAHALAGRLGRVDIAAVREAALGPLASAETASAIRAAGSPRDALTLLFASPEFMHR
jgi:uncharacterized protein (DUF1800 family)